MFEIDCVPVKLRALPLDTHLECKIYFKKASSDNPDGFAFLCENQTMTAAFIDRLKRTIFPESKVYIPRKFVVDFLFKNGHFVGYTEEEVKAIENLENPWEKSRPEKVSPPPKIQPVKSASQPASASKSVAKKPSSLDGRSKILESKLNAQKLREVIKAYDTSKAITEDLMKSAAKTGRIDVEKSRVVTGNIQNQIKNTDASFLIQTINRIRMVDEYLHTHCLNVAFLNGLIGKWLKFDSVQQDELVEVGLFHDLGKLKISQEIVQKESELTEEEFFEMKKHPNLSMETLMKSGVRNRAVLEGVLQHHERVNGTGYPRGLVANKICEYAKITAISDTYDAMVTKRVHADSHSPFVILGEFDRGAYSELDFNYVGVFINCMVDELKGKQIIMNDGREATVLLVNPSRLLYPVVEVDGEVVKTSDSFYCVRMKNALNDK